MIKLSTKEYEVVSKRRRMIMISASTKNHNDRMKEWEDGA